MRRPFVVSLALFVSLMPMSALAGDGGSPTTAHPSRHGSSVIVDEHGPLVVERYAGAVVRTKRSGAPRARLALHAGLGELVHDGAGRAFVADRAGDRIVELSVDGRLAIVEQVTVPEPFGLALTPDGATLLATSISDHTLVGIDLTDLGVAWKVELEAEPRGVAVAADGSKAAVGFLSSGALAVVDLGSARHAVHWQRLSSTVGEDVGGRFARNTWAVTFLGNARLAAAHAVAIPEDWQRGDGKVYMGTPTIPPMSHAVALVGGSGPREVGLDVHQPRALAYDSVRDTLYIGGYGDDRIAALGDASGYAPYLAWTAQVGGKGTRACGVDGLALDADRLWIHCELSRRLVRLDVATVVHRHARRAQTGELPTELAKTWKVGPELAPSVRAPAVEIGAELFRRAGDRRLSLDGGLACASCHPDGRADGLTWRRGDKQAVVHEKCFTFSSGGGKAERVPCRDFDFTRVQTPILAGRVRDTAPYKWSGRDDTLHESIRKTVSVLDGQPKRLHRWEVAALARYVRSLAPPRPPTVVDVDAVARGRALFESDRLGCAGCHAGPRFTDRDQHDLASLETDTPSLLGAAHSAPYLHGGAADSLSELLTDAGLDMADVSDLSDAERDDLIHFLRSL